MEKFTWVLFIMTSLVFWTINKEVQYSLEANWIPA